MLNDIQNFATLFCLFFLALNSDIEALSLYFILDFYGFLPYTSAILTYNFIK